MAKQEIQVVVNMPSTEAGKEALRERLAEFNARMLAYALNKIDVPHEAKLRYLESLHGRVPWAQEGGELHA